MGRSASVVFWPDERSEKNWRSRRIMPVGSSQQLLKFLNNLQVSRSFFEAHVDSKPADSLKRKLVKHWSKIHCEFVLLKYLGNCDLKNGVIHTELAPWQSLLALLWICRKTPVFVTMHNSLSAQFKMAFFL